MKKLIMLILAMLLVVATFAGCSRNVGTEGGNSSESTSTPSVQPTEPDLTETPTTTEPLLEMDIEPYIGDGDFAFFIRLQPGVREISGEMYEASLYYLGFYGDGTVIYATYPLRSMEDISKIIQIAPLSWFQKGNSDVFFEGEYHIEGRKLIFYVANVVSGRITDFVCTMSSEGNLSFSSHTPSTENRAEGTYQYGGSSKNGKIQWIEGFKFLGIDN